MKGLIGSAELTEHVTLEQIKLTYWFRLTEMLNTAQVMLNVNMN